MCLSVLGLFQVWYTINKLMYKAREDINSLAMELQSNEPFIYLLGLSFPVFGLY